MKKASKFTRYTPEDCECRYCLHYQGRGKPCQLDTCCCAEEKREALERLPAQPVHPFAHSRAALLV